MSTDPVASAAASGEAEAALARVLDLPASAVVACAGPEEAFALALGVIPESDRTEVIVPAILAERGVEAVEAAGRLPVPADVEAEFGTIATRGVVQSAGPQSAALLVAHAFGHPATMADLLAVAREQALAVVEDITGALGASFRGVPVGRMGDAAVFLGRPGDPVTRGAFAILPRAEQTAAARSTRGAPTDKDAIAVIAELRRLDEELTARRRAAWELSMGLRGLKAIVPMPHSRWIRHAYPRYVVRLRSSLWKRPLAETVEMLRARGVACEVASGPSLHRALRERLPDDPRLSDDAFPVASRLPAELIAIPLHAGLTSTDMDEVAAVLRQVEEQSL